MQAEELHKKARSAAGALLAVAILMVIGGFVKLLEVSGGAKANRAAVRRRRVVDP